MLLVLFSQLCDRRTSYLATTGTKWGHDFYCENKAGIAVQRLEQRGDQHCDPTESKPKRRE